MLSKAFNLDTGLRQTAQSIVGDFDAVPLKCVLWMLKNNLVYVIESDANSPVGRPPILHKAVKVVSDMLGEEAAKKMVPEHPKMILEGETFNK